MPLAATAYFAGLGVIVACLKQLYDMRLRRQSDTKGKQAVKGAEKLLSRVMRDFIANTNSIDLHQARAALNQCKQVLGDSEDVLRLEEWIGNYANALTKKAVGPKKAAAKKAGGRINNSKPKSTKSKAAKSKKKPAKKVTNKTGGKGSRA